MSEEAPGTVPEGKCIGRYQILKRIGAGAMGEVFLARDPHIDRSLAIKTVRLGGLHSADSTKESDNRLRLLREAKAAGKLLHPHIVTLFDADEAEGELFLAFEYVEGCDLERRMASSPPLTLREALQVVRQVAEGLAYAHERGVIHRDVKPSNILLDERGGAKVADFGIARLRGQATELTTTGAVIGSPQYLAPEQVRGEELDGRNDLFSLGVVLYQLLTGQRPFAGETVTTLVYQILHHEPPPVRQLRPSLPPQLESLLARLLAK
ncbi:MAG: serine/threonine protein kinase, partial [Acidobacteria bacterium]|nr:serine/threonine protein kinase [Acidobacteriota bacterium]